MSRSKKLFVAFAIVFAILLAWASYDIASRTTFPGSKPQLKERIKKQFSDSVEVAKDTTVSTHR
ncbi:MAG: hypothetical protein AB7K37_10865 [Cyclobacteriaceae bacterium]